MDKLQHSERHWIGLEQLQSDSFTYDEKLEQEFYEKPLDYFQNIEKNHSSEWLRREFLTVMGASMAMASLNCARRPVHKIIPYVVKPEEITLGEANYYSSVCQSCHNGCGLTVKTREGRPIKFEGNLYHPINQGALCARGQAGVLSIYDPDRVKQFVFKTQHSAEQLNYSQIRANIFHRLESVRSVRILSAPLHGRAKKSVVKDFLSTFPDGKLIEFDLLNGYQLSDAQYACYENHAIPEYFFEKASFVLSIGADFLGTYQSFVKNARRWSLSRQPEKHPFSKLVVFESAFSITGASADQRIPIKPLDELKIVLAILNELVVRHRKITVDQKFLPILSSYDAALVGQQCHIDAKVFERIALELWDHRGQSIVLCGGLSNSTIESKNLHIAVNYLNSLLGNEGKTIDGNASCKAIDPHSFSQAAFQEFINEIQSQKVDVLIIEGVNPVFHFPSNLHFAELLKKIPLIISFNLQPNETGSIAHAIMAASHPQEKWSDSEAMPNVVSIVQPTIRPLYDTCSLEEFLFDWIKIKQKNDPFISSVTDWFEYLKGVWKQNIYSQAKSLAPFEDFWESALRQGFVDLRSETLPKVRSFQVKALQNILKLQKNISTGIPLLAVYPLVSLGDGQDANNAWLQELPHPLTSVTWDNYVSISEALAIKLSLKQNDIVRIESQGRFLEIPVVIQPGIHPETVSIAIGYGRKIAGKVGLDTGINPFIFSEWNESGFHYSGCAVSLHKTGRVYPLASTQWHFVTEKRPILSDVTYQEYRQGAALNLATHPELVLKEDVTMWPKHAYAGPRWGMTIDLTACIGCSACVIACQAENNIPVVGREQVRKSRIMHWIRIDRYFRGSSESPEVVFQPMLCQHCENAPCETVCPVLATVHDKEGLNVQVYNRCVGTRYCQNNCPYKVRRFNFFDHWKTYQGSLAYIWNPDVTVRSRGIMEKCTFCHQRIREAKDKAKDAQLPVSDGMFQTACQQTCPTNAITFGDMNDQTSHVNKLKKSKRVFHALEVLNTRPVVSYMSKVRNK